MSNNPFKDEKLTLFENILCAWPLIMVFFGGAIGGACGALAWVLNRKIMLRDDMGWVRYPAVIITGLFGIALYFIVVIIFVLMFPGLFEEQGA